MDCKDNQGKSYCYARRMYARFKWNPKIRYIGRMALFDEMLRIPRDKHQRIFIGSTMELFGDWIRPYWMWDIFEVINAFSFFTFIFLTKQPQNLAKWSPFPENVYLGVTVTNQESFDKAIHYLKMVDAKIKFISFEPLLERITFEEAGISWLIIGQQTPVSRKTEPKIEWIAGIVEAADKASVPVFLKDNLKPLLGDNLCQEFPKGGR